MNTTIGKIALAAGILISGSGLLPVTSHAAAAPVTTSSVESMSSDSEQIEKVIETGLSYLGTPYEFGSDRSTTYTFDCSDFVRHIFLEAIDHKLPADSRKQAAYVKEHGNIVSETDQLERGDLVFFMRYKGSLERHYASIDRENERVTHVGLYLGNGQILHTYSKASGGVRIDTLDGSWAHRFLYGGSIS